MPGSLIRHGLRGRAIGSFTIGLLTVAAGPAFSATCMLVLRREQLSATKRPGS